MDMSKMDKFQKYMQEEFVGKDPNKPDVGRDIFKSLKENWIEKIGYIPRKPMALLQVTDSGSKVLKAIGFSDPNDLLLDNFGVMMASCCNTGSDVQRNIVDTGGVVRTIHFQENQNLRMAFANETSPSVLSLGGLFRVGTGVTAPTRADFQIETPFVSAPLSSFRGVITPVWISAQQEAIVTTMITGILSGGTIFECGMYVQLRIGFSTGKATIMLSHDATNTPFNDQDHIQMTYTWSLS